MRKLLLITTALIAFGTTPAQADPISTVVALLMNGVPFGAALTATFGWAGAAALQIAGSMLLSRAAMALRGKPKQDVQRAELSRPTALPAYRFVYGTGWAPGTPVAWHVVGEHLYICYLLNSRPSALTSHTVLFDKRATVVTGNAFNFAGGGAVANNDVFNGHVNYWIGRGNQTTCPAQIVSGSGGYFAATDAWQGRTVLWAKLHCGDQGQRSERWPATPPELNVEGDWSLIFDPRTSTTAASSNQALIVLDALRNNPIRPYADAFLRLDTFSWAANVADEAIAAKAGGTIPRYRADGVLVWSEGAELEDQIGPLLDAGASRLVRIGGQLGIVPACARGSVHTISDFSDSQAISLTRWQPSDEIATECVASYVAPDRAYEAAEAPAYIVAGAQAADGGVAKRLDLQLDFVTDHRQAQRLAKIAVLRSRMQRQISGELFPNAFKLVAGSVAVVDLPAPYTAWNGLYEVEQINPAAGINDDQSITLRLPVTLRETSAAIYAWNAATEEQTVEGAALDPWIARLGPPTGVTLTSGGDAAMIDEDGAVTPRVQLSWAPSAGSSTTRYEWQYQTQVAHLTGGGGGEVTWIWQTNWTDGGLVDPNAGYGATIAVWIAPVNVGRPYRARVRAAGVYGNSEWVQAAQINASAPARTLPQPQILLAVGGAGAIDLTLRQANDAAASKMEIWGGDTNVRTASTRLATIPAGANVTVNYTEAALGPSKRRYYWLRARDNQGNASTYTALATAITNP